MPIFFPASVERNAVALMTASMSPSPTAVIELTDSMTCTELCHVAVLLARQTAISIGPALLAEAGRHAATSDGVLL